MAQSDVDKLREEDAHLASTERGIAQRRADLARRIAQGETSIAYFQSFLSNGSQPSVVREEEEEENPRGEIVSDFPFVKHRRGYTMGDRIVEYMESVEGEATVSQVADFLVNIGRFPPGERKEAYRLAYSTVLRDTKRFVKVDAGRFRLKRASANSGSLSQSTAGLATLSINSSSAREGS